MYWSGIQTHRQNAQTCFEGPFGEVVRKTGAMANAVPFRFSTKYQVDETGLLYYGVRYYNAITGRWLSRDAIEEGGGFYLNAFARNSPIGCCDLLGLLLPPGQGGTWPPIPWPPESDQSPLDDWEVFKEFLKFWIQSDGTKPFVRENGAWGEFMKAYPDIRMTAQSRYSQIAMELLSSGKKKGGYSFAEDLQLNRSYPLVVTLNGVKYTGYGRYEIGPDCTLQLYENKHGISDLADAEGKKDWALWLRFFYGQFTEGETFQFFPVEIEWDSADLYFKESNGGVAVLTPFWPFNQGQGN